MSFPTPGTPWPPTEYAPALNQIAADDSWLRGAPPTTGVLPSPFSTRAQYNGGVVGAVARATFGKPGNSQGQISERRHLKLAYQLVQAKANMVAGKPPQITPHPEDAPQEYVAQDGSVTLVGDSTLSDALERYTSTDTFAASYTEAVTKSGSHGWRYGRIVWDQGVDTSPWVEWVDADGGMARFEHGREVSVIFWDEHKGTKDSEVFRLFQEHTPGRITYQLYKGTSDKVGSVVPFEDHAATAYLADVVDIHSGIDTGIPPKLGILTATMIHNGDKNPNWRHDPLLRFYGYSDVAKGNNVWEDLDEVHTDFIHEVGSARARLFVNENLLESETPGRGQTFNYGRDIYPMAEGGRPNESQMERVQFDIRTEQYLQARQTIILDGVDAVELSPITVGKDPQATGDMTATEITARSRKSLETFNKVGRQERAGMSRLLTAWSWRDALSNGYTPPTLPVQVALTEPVEQTPLDLANEINALDTAGAISLYWKVRKAHPEWSKEQVDEEVQRIREDQNAVLPVDPFNVGADAFPGGE